MIFNLADVKILTRPTLISIDPEVTRFRAAFKLVPVLFPSFAPKASYGGSPGYQHDLVKDLLEGNQTHDALIISHPYQPLDRHDSQSS